MTQSNNSSPITESPQNACPQQQIVRIVDAEQLKRFLIARRSTVFDARRKLLWEAGRLKDEIAAYDQLLNELTIE